MKPLLLLILCNLALSCLAQTDSIPKTDSLRAIWFQRAKDSCIEIASAGRFAEALPWGKALERYYNEGGPPSGRATNYYIEAELYRIMGQSANAIAYYDLAIGVFDSIKAYDNPALLRTYTYTVSRKGYTYSEIGDVEDAEPYIVKALPLMMKANMVVDYAQGMLNLGIMADARGGYSTSFDWDARARAILDTVRPGILITYLQFCLYSNEASTYMKMGNIPEALAHIKASLDMADRLDTSTRDYKFYIRNDYINILLNSVDAYVADGQFDKAETQCRKAEALIPNGIGSSPGVNLLQKKALLAEKQGRITESIDLLRSCIRICDTLPSKPEDYDFAMVDLGVLYNQTGQFFSADSLFRLEASHLRQKDLVYSYAMQQAMSGLCTSLLGRGAYAEAADSLLVLSRLSLRSMRVNFPGMSEDDQLKYKQGLEGVSDLLYTCLSHNGSYKRDVLRETYSLELQQKNLVLNSEAGILERARNSRDTLLSEAYRAWLGNRQVLSQQYTLPYDQRRFSTDSLEAVNKALEKRISARGGPPGGAPQTSRPAPASASVEFIRFHLGVKDSVVYAALVLRSGETTPIFVRLCSETALRRLLEDAHGKRIDDDQLTRELYDSRSNGSHRLYRLVWQPLDPYLANIHDVYYSTAGLLNNIAFQAIHTGKDYLMTRYGLHRYLDVADRSAAAAEPPQAINVWGNINYDTATYTGNTSDNALSPDAGAVRKDLGEGPMQALGASEVNNLKSLFHDLSFTSYEGAAATEENFKLQAPSTQGILHISTHGFYTPFRGEMARATTPGSFIAGTVNPLFRCGLAFAGANYYWVKGVPRNNRDDGILTGFEIEQLDLHQVQLVTLSACETGLGDVTDNEGALGLQRAFRLAGVRRLLVSLWQVPAKQTAELISLFYAGWLDGKEPGEALRVAENTLRQKGYPPYYWAGFVLIE